ncbi:MAG TPA: hypothetical protein VGO62_15935 [Myxococcota bacterium]|jgi:hypothetical protein
MSLASDRRAIRIDTRRRLEEVRTWLRAQPEIQQAQAERDARRRRRLLLILLLLLLLLLLIHCDELWPTPAPEVPGVVDAGPAALPKLTAAKKKPATDAIKKRARPPIDEGAIAGPPWLAAFRLQVTARSTRLARCFSGVAKPGGLRWTATVDAANGTVSAQELEAIDAILSDEQQQCLRKVLADPRYRLTSDAKPTPSRISLLLEF